MDFVIKPYLGVGPILLGMTSQQIEQVLSLKPEKFKKYEDDEFETDVYDFCNVYYKSPGICEAIEFFSPAQVRLNGVNLLGKPFNAIKKLFMEIDETTVIEECNCF